MTAEQVTAHLKDQGIQITSPHTISHEIAEYMRADWFKHYPLHDLIYDQEHRDNYLKGVEWTEEKGINPHPFP